jgi:hypothetical protein
MCTIPGSATLEGVVIELMRLRERVEILEDLHDLDAAIERNAGKPSVPWQDVCNEFGWDFDNPGRKPDH